MTATAATDKDRSWMLATMSADASWKRAVDLYWAGWRAPDQRGYDAWRASEDARMAEARRRYRGEVLGAFWKYLAPLQVGEVVPRMVAELLAEEAHP